VMASAHSRTSWTPATTWRARELLAEPLARPAQ
jgi:hypothetical protein